MAASQAMSSGRLDEIRASDAERAEVADLLTKHFMDGRLDRSEFDERLGTALGAKTRGELAALLYDLPGTGGNRPVQASPRRRARRSMAPLALICLLGCLLIAAASSLSVGVHRVAVAHHGFGGPPAFITQSQRVFSLAPALVAVLLVAIVCLAVHFFHARELED